MYILRVSKYDTGLQEFWTYGTTYLKHTKLVFKTDYLLMQIKNIAETILQYFRPSWSY